MLSNCSVLEGRTGHSVGALRPVLDTQAMELLNMSSRDLPSIDYLRQRLSYDPDTGKLYWLAHSGMPAKWNTRYAGSEALGTLNKSGHKYGSVDGCKIKAHRVVWALHYGVWPDGDIDHINQRPADNRIENLRVVTKTTNMRNVARTRANTSGATGVVWYKRKSKWHARVCVDGKQRSLGYYDSFDDAVVARKRANAELGFHTNHGSERLST